MIFEMIKAIHSALGTESTLAFVLVIALGAAVVFGFVAFVFDKGYKREKAERVAEEQSKRKEDHTSETRIDPKEQTEIIRHLSQLADEGNHLILRNKEKTPADWATAKEWATRAEEYLEENINEEQAAYFSLATTKAYPGLAIDRRFVDWVFTRIERLGEIATDIRTGKLIPHGQNKVKSLVPVSHEKAKPNIVIIGEPRLTPVAYDEKFLFSESLKGVVDERWGVVLDFQNQFTTEQEIASLFGVRAELIFANETGTLVPHRVNPGFWFGANNEQVNFERGDTHRLFIGFIAQQPDTKKVYVTTFDRRFVPPAPVTFSPYDSIRVGVRLFTQTRHRFDKECELELTPRLTLTKPFA